MAVAVLVTVIMLALVIARFSSRDWRPERIQETIETGDSISKLLGRYKHENSTYPSSLDALIPGYTNTVKPPVVGNMKWDYVSDGMGFYLGVNGEREESEPVLYRTNESDAWYMDTK